MARIIKSSRETCPLLRYYTVQSPEFLTNILGQPIGPISKQQKIQKREHSRTDVN